MRAQANPAAPGSPLPHRKSYVWPVIGLLLLSAMVYDTKVIRAGSAEDKRAGTFSAEAYGKKAFPAIQTAILESAVDAKELANALARDKEAASEKYGKPGSVGPIFSVKLSGVGKELKSGNLSLQVSGLPESLGIRVQTGPAINGTEVRDATGTVQFGSFTNQIEYQDAGSALNNEVKSHVLAKLQRDALVGKKVELVGVFQLINPSNWLITPVQMVVQ